VVVLDARVENRARAEQILRREEYWAIGTDDPRTVSRLVRVAAADLVVVDLGMGALEAIPGWQRRRSDLLTWEQPPRHHDGYAALRPLQADPSCARFPLVVLKADLRSEESPGPSRFGIVDYLANSSLDEEFLDGLEAVFRDVVEPRRRKERQLAESGATEEQAVGTVLSFPHRVPGRGSLSDTEPGPGRAAHPRPFDNVPKALRTALLVDPDVGYRRFVRGVLVEHGFTVHEASTAAEGLRLAAARRPWLILSEVNLPDETGFDFCVRVRSNRLLRHTPFAFLSDWDDYDRRYFGFKLGADDYLTKPVPERELLIRLQVVLRRYADIQTESPQGSRLQGTIDLLGAPEVLQMCHLNQLTGALTATRGGQVVRIWCRRGEIVHAASASLRGAEAVYEFVSWSQGSFEFVPGAAPEGSSLGESVDGLILEGCRRLDERRRDRQAGA
jgi:DNA-binding response OmpR family regulator